jgi:hypothetical protein
VPLAVLPDMISKKPLSLTVVALANPPLETVSLAPPLTVVSTDVPPDRTISLSPEFRTLPLLVWPELTMMNCGLARMLFLLGGGWRARHC